MVVYGSLFVASLIMLGDFMFGPGIVIKLFVTFLVFQFSH